jgi:hypothetical protein
MIDPTGDEKDKMYSDRIQFIITKDGTKYDFDTPPIFSNNTIVGKAVKSVSIPLSDVSKVNGGDGRDRVSSDRIRFVVTNDGMEYAFDTPPAISNNSIVGKATQSVSIPMSEVSRICVTKSNPVGTVFLVLGAAALVVGIVFMVSFNKKIESVTW